MSTATKQASPVAQDARSRFRPDIEGLRAVAVLLVVLYHAGVPWLRGGFIGVDVFFVISGYLITGMLIREGHATGSISLSNFFARRVKRLLPAATTVLVACAVAIWLWAPAPLKAVFGLDVTSAAAYVSNWRFAGRAVDYLAEDVARSPVLHFWSLSVEEQFYFAWPLLLGLVFLLARRFGTHKNRLVAAALLMVAIPSFAWSVVQTQTDPAAAFFVTPTRLWELATGALAATAVAAGLALRGRMAKGALGVGLALIAFAGVLFANAASWPGAAALVPVAGATLVILAGSGATGFPGRALDNRLMVWIGGLSYSIYLWHWPVLVVGQDWWHRSSPKWTAVLVAVGFALAWLSKRLIEDPVRFARRLALPRNALSLGAALVVIGVGSGLALPLTVANVPSGGPIELAVTGDELVVSPATAGAMSLTPHDQGEVVLTPSPLKATKDVPQPWTKECMARMTSAVPIWCDMGADGATTRFVVLGDSKIEQYATAIDASAQALDWAGQMVTKSGCTFSAASLILDSGERYTACEKFNAKVMAELRLDPPDYAIISGRTQKAALPGEIEASTESAVEGMAQAWRELQALGIVVIVVLDNPDPVNSTTYECAYEHSSELSACNFDREDAIDISAAPEQRAAAERAPGVRLVDLTDSICLPDACRVALGNVLVYRQGSHLTDSYAKTLAPQLLDALKDAQRAS